MTDKKIIFFDIDGTLLDHDKKLPQSTKEAINELKQAGHEVAIATGRAPFMYEDLREELGIYNFVSYNGQYVEVDGEMIYGNPLDKDKLEEITELAATNDHPLVYMGKKTMKANVEQHDHIDESIGTLKVEAFPTHDPDYFKMEHIYQTLLFCEHEEEKYYEEKFNAFDFIRWHPLSVDVLPAGGSKAKGIEKMIEKLGINPENVYAFGDGLNDIEMLSTVAHGVAMGNAHEETKEAARYLSKSVDEDGIVHGLKMVGLLK
ncbi:putative hydrolase of the HAD superfamily protein [Alkalihalophilus pseudofirmus OF4]|uniref:Hydrolase of the HAD superfamily protein n=1 Tax=Alkalihalophilus pseudofirmus (strain ATCC BAA-2126 / JCM 17055 / OF4) TaxID=398511 RepID=D3FWN1_ALKPO|nr:Cof-type HAD-IIB family hydrolase [Alkalihalophilus pseudofirmus]ADC50529.1 putative hydrolase of the HAD superfamily protein [Alkalihalophilus pseudofirmus OF4]WEG17818.1 Cof-type HAD-IIB family hydrolase [Alkalihalophilus pseudofirmus]